VARAICHGLPLSSRVRLVLEPEGASVSVPVYVLVRIRPLLWLPTVAVKTFISAVDSGDSVSSTGAMGGPVRRC